jgi:hypothetical protein
MVVPPVDLSASEIDCTAQVVKLKGALLVPAAEAKI